MNTPFSVRLNRLFEGVYPPGRGPHTATEVIETLRMHGYQMSRPYMSQLRSGSRTNPSSRTIEALAGFFRVDPRYFTDDDFYSRVDFDLMWLATRHDEQISRIVAGAAELSPTARHMISRHVEELRRKDHLDS
ncbi:transcriptional regulator [Mycolicibacterium farcinogenes]|uniref:Transcriptional regulator n=1 Tax=Mycolicibacterium farcinogenes TaxID=1802 RepID=A0ACD1FR61_MYCFR|nr:transcriptional regulator [Mycolicibacterium farcinogenes]QZH69400.1 transcriptional regulator [Mycolicibacterium farcinogenes]